MSERLEEIKLMSKTRFSRVILQISSQPKVREALQAKVNAAIEQITSLRAINGRYVEENVSLKRYFVGKIAKSDTLAALIGASLIHVKCQAAEESTATAVYNFELFYQSNGLVEFFGACASEDVALKNFTKWMFIAVSGVGIVTAGNQTLLINICAILENIETESVPIKRYISGGGKTKAMLCRLLVYESIAGDRIKVQKYRSEIIESAATAGPGSGKLSLDIISAEVVEQFAQWPIDHFALLRDQLSSLHHAPLVSYSIDQLKFLEAVHCLFADIPYFATILHRPLAVFYDQLMTWQQTNPTNFAQLPKEGDIIHTYLLAEVDDKIKTIKAFGDIKTHLRAALVASKIVFLQAHCQFTLLPSETIDFDSFRAYFENFFDFTTDEAASPDITQEWQWMHNYRNIVSLVHVTAKANQDIYFEVGQRMEGSGRAYSKGGSCTVPAWRRLVIIDHVTNKLSTRRRKPHQLTTTANSEIESKSETETNVEDKKRRKVLKVSIAAAPNWFENDNIDVDFLDLNTNELVNMVESAEQGGNTTVHYQATGNATVPPANTSDYGDIFLRDAMTNMSLEESQSTVEDPEVFQSQPLNDVHDLLELSISGVLSEQHEAYLMSISTLNSLKSYEGKEDA